MVLALHNQKVHGLRQTNPVGIRVVFFLILEGCVNEDWEYCQIANINLYYHNGRHG